MKKTLLISFFLSFATLTFSQKKISHEDLKTSDVSAFAMSYFDEYVAIDGHTYKVDDTIKIGRPSSNKTFAFILSGDAIITPVVPASVTSAGHNTIIKKIYLSGTKRAGYRIYFKTKGFCGICPPYLINVEEAFATEELQSKGMTSDKALSELKKAKEKLDLGIITQDDFDKLKSELSKYIK